jgi:tetratricopeptide (TPR) repeat protein
LQGAHQRYLDTPDSERVYSVPEALRLLAEYVVLSIAVGARTYDSPLIASLPALLEPFIALSPGLDVIWRNATAAYRSHCQCRYAEAHAIWIEVLAKLETMTDEVQHLEPIRGAVTFGVGIMEAQLGLAAASQRAARLDHDPYQKITALQLRKIVRLEQGDWIGADQLRRQAEVLSLQVRTAPMFKTLLSVEASAYAKARDLGGLQQVIEQMKLMAAEYPGWVPPLRDVEARFHLVRADYAAALLGFEQAIELTKFGVGELSLNMSVWVSSQAGLAETLLCMGRLDEARTRARAALQICEERRIGNHANDLIRILGLVEAKFGDARAAERVDALIAAQLAGGVTGLRLGLSYEARAQIAIWSADSAGFERYSQLTAREYRYGLGCPLGARYERLINEAERHGMGSGAQLADFTPALETALTLTDDPNTKVTRVLAGARDNRERAARALRLLCVAWRARTGHLYETTPGGLHLSASLEALSPPSATRLNELVQAFATRELDRVESLDDMATSAVDMTQNSTIQLAEDTYDLLLLTCMEGSRRKVAGVVALAANAGDPADLERFQLIPAVAAQLLDPASGQN